MIAPGSSDDRSTIEADYENDPFCPRHGRESRPAEIPGLPCQCPPASGKSCNQHEDCEKADREARRYTKANRLRGFSSFGAEHCHDECCEDCFGS